jgi:uncharacterized membrane protein YsdA (DUF1294 family)/cold shock CspA family protein
LNTRSVRLAGRIEGWNDARGFGFVVPNGGGDRCFAHVSAFERGARRPVEGDLVSYLPTVDSRGRRQAIDIRHARKPSAPRTQRSRVPRTGIAVTALAAIAGAAAIGVMPVALAGVYLLLSVVTFCMYYADKAAAQRDAWRTPESTLHLASLLGGWPGALLAQRWLRHKSAKSEFLAVFWATVVINVAATGWLVRTGEVARLIDSFVR